MKKYYIIIFIVFILWILYSFYLWTRIISYKIDYSAKVTKAYFKTINLANIVSGNIISSFDGVISVKNKLGFNIKLKKMKVYFYYNNTLFASTNEMDIIAKSNSVTENKFTVNVKIDSNILDMSKIIIQDNIISIDYVAKMKLFSIPLIIKDTFIG